MFTQRVVVRGDKELLTKKQLNRFLTTKGGSAEMTNVVKGFNNLIYISSRKIILLSCLFRKESDRRLFFLSDLSCRQMWSPQDR